MDGFAVRSQEAAASGADFPVVGVVAAGGVAESFQKEMPRGTVRRIATGAPLPAGADAVIPIEQSEVTAEGGLERVRFNVTAVAPWQNVHRRASDAQATQIVLSAGTRLGPQHIGIAAAVGASELVVAQRPRITLLTTGDEVLPPTTATNALEPQQIRNSNGPMLAAMLAAIGTPLLRHEHVPDDPEVIRAAAREALAHSHLVLTVGGVSVGQRDFLPWAWQNLGLTTILHGVNIQPGKPLLAVRDDCKLVLGLPGNPVSVLCAAHIFAWPVIRRMLGQPCAEPPWRTLPLAETAKASGKREVFRAATALSDGSVRIVKWHGSGDLIHTASADGFIRLPLTDEPVAAGTPVRFLDMAR